MDCLLQKGAVKVYGVDVGFGQVKPMHASNQVAARNNAYVLYEVRLSPVVAGFAQAEHATDSTMLHLLHHRFSWYSNTSWDQCTIPELHLVSCTVDEVADGANHVQICASAITKSVQM